jgi:hypothetical protein
LCGGIAIDYKAYARSLPAANPGAAGLFVVATCYYEISDMTVFFEAQEPDHLRLMQQPPTGFFRYMRTCYIASHCTALELSTPLPAGVTITDAHGTRVVPVKPWG